MAVNQSSPMTLKASAAVEFHRLLKLDSEEVKHNSEAETDVPIGVSLPVTHADSYESGDMVSIRDIKDGGTAKVEVDESVSAGDDLYAADDGKVQGLPSDAGTYRKVGVALQAASGSDEIIEAWLNNDGETEDVS